MRAEREHGGRGGDIGFCSTPKTGFDSLKAYLVILFLLTLSAGGIWPSASTKFSNIAANCWRPGFNCYLQLEGADLVPACIWSFDFGGDDLSVPISAAIHQGLSRSVQGHRHLQMPKTGKLQMTHPPSHVEQSYDILAGFPKCRDLASG